jgi:O-antigen/teichoic acid export membrane protein
MALDTGILLTGRTGPVALANWVAAIVAIAGFYLLVKPWGAEGAALATTAAFATRFGMIYWLSQRVHRIHYRWAPVLQLMLSGALVVTLATFVRVSGPIVSILVHGLFFCAFVAANWFSGVLEPVERERIIAELRRRSSRLRGALAIS